MASNFINMSGKAIADRVGFGESGVKKTPFIEVMIQTIRADGTEGEVLPWKGWLTQNTIAKTVEQLQLLGARVQGGDFEDLYGIGSKVANVAISTDPQFGSRVEFINPSGRSSISDDTRLDKGKLAALKAALKPHALGAVIANGGGKAPSPAAPPPWQRNGGPPPSAPQAAQNPAADVEPWSELDAYEGLEQPSQAAQQSAPRNPSSGPGSDPRDAQYRQPPNRQFF